MSLDLEDSVCSAIRLEDTMRSPWGLYHSSLTGSPIAGSKCRERVMKPSRSNSLFHQLHKEADFTPMFLEMFTFTAEERHFHVSTHIFTILGFLQKNCPWVCVSTPFLQGWRLLTSSVFPCLFSQNDLTSRNDNLPGLCFEKMSCGYEWHSLGLHQPEISKRDRKKFLKLDWLFKGGSDYGSVQLS